MSPVLKLNQSQWFGPDLFKNDHTIDWSLSVVVSTIIMGVMATIMLESVLSSVVSVNVKQKKPSDILLWLCE